MASLDRKKPYGEIYGGGKARYEQGGVYFDHEGEEVNMGKATTRSAAAPAPSALAAAGGLPTVEAMAEMDAPALHALAAQLKVKVHPAAGVKKLVLALTDPLKKALEAAPAPSDQVDTQLAG